MRGAERPAKVSWTRPFLLPLTPLSDDAAWQTFIDITDDSHDKKDVIQLLRLTDNMPLAIDLIAQLVDYEGSSNVLARWETERTSILSNGWNKRSSLDASIAVSLSSSRLSSVPGAQQLLSLLAILPDGLSDTELIQCNFPIKDILTCKAVLLQTCLAYVDDRLQLKALVPIREYVLKIYPPSLQLVHPLFKHFWALLELFRQFVGGQQFQGLVDRLALKQGNVHSVLVQELHTGNPELLDAIYCTLSYNFFRRTLSYGWTKLMDYIPALFPQPRDPRLEASFSIELLCSAEYHSITNPELLSSSIIDDFHVFSDSLLECMYSI